MAMALLAAAAAAYTAARGRLGPAAAAPRPHTPATLVAAPAEDRVMALEARLREIEIEKAALETRAADTARKHAEARAAGHSPDVPTVIVHAQEEARRRVQADQERRLHEEQLRLEAEQRAAEERLAQQRRAEPEPTAAAAPATGRAVAAGGATPSTDVSLPVAPVTPPAILAAPALTESPPPAVSPGTLVALDEPGVIAPVLDRASAPRYPPVALRQKLEGVVHIRALVDENGNVVETQLVAGVSGRSGLNEEAVSNVRERKYRPAEKDGVPVKVWVPVRVQFRLPRTTDLP
jgi:TonB family protein